MMKEVELTQAARDWVSEQGGVLTLRAMPQHGCCGGHATVPVAEVRAPDSKSDYEVLTVDGVTIYRAKVLAEGAYRIDLAGFWRWRRLHVEGRITPGSHKYE